MNPFLLFIALLLALNMTGCGSSGGATDGDLDTEAAEGDTALDGEADSEDADSAAFPACGHTTALPDSLIPHEGQDGYDEALAKKAARYDRHSQVLASAPMGLAVDTSVAPSATDKRAAIQALLDGTGPASVDVTTMVDGWNEVAGLYAGAGVAADAMRYAILRAQGADCAVLAAEQAHLTQALEGVHLAFDITGHPGMVARGLLRKDLPGASGITTVPLFDDKGKPLPAEKDNGTYRDDASGRHPDYLWKDSCSRDMLLGWAAAVGVGMEVIRDDPAFSDDLKSRLAADAHGFVTALSTVRASGYDLEWQDPDGRTTYYGYLNENSLDRGAYLDGANNGFYALMAVGIVAAFAEASQNADDQAYLATLINTRHLPEMARDSMLFIDMGITSNYSGYNMAFFSAFLALRYTPDAAARAILAQAVETQLYHLPSKTWQPADQKMSLFDLVHLYALQGGGLTPETPGLHDEVALASAIETLNGFATPPYYDFSVTQCDDAELASGTCTFSDGTVSKVYPNEGRGDSTVCEKPIPKAIRRPSNYEWRSNPYEPNGGGEGGSLYSGSDFRIAYWMGRFLTR